jgi:hypothetical protein
METAKMFKSTGCARRDHVLSHLRMEKRGIEIAPYFNPVTDKSIHDVFYVDCIDNDEIQRKAGENPGGIGKTVPLVDSVWVPGERLLSCVNNQLFEYAIASHVFEHVPNPIGWLLEILDCLEIGATLALLIPNREHSMDYYRRVTSFGELVGWHLEKPRIPTPGQIMDFLSDSFEDTGVVDYNKKMVPFVEAKRHYSDTQAFNYAEWTANENKYLDVHCTVWTPASFVEVFERVAKLGLLPVQLTGPFVGFPGSIAGEFLVYMRKCESKP